MLILFEECVVNDFGQIAEMGRCRTSVRSVQASTSSRRSPANGTLPLPARNARICSRLVVSESSMLMINPQHPDLPLQAHLV